MIGSFSTPFVCPGPCERCGDITQNYGQCANCLSMVKPGAVEMDAEQARGTRLDSQAKQRLEEAELRLRLSERIAS